MTEHQEPLTFVLPARAGMSPAADEKIKAEYGAPRTGGDEPARLEKLTVGVSCSPHGRG